MFTFKRTLLVFSMIFSFCYGASAMADAWLLGFEGGYGTRNYTVNATTTVASPTLVAPLGGIPVGTTLAMHKQKFSDDGSVWALFLGYQWDWHPVWVTSFEARLTFDNFDHPNSWSYHDSVGGGNLLYNVVSYERGPMIEASATVGLKTGRIWMPYFRLGGMTSNDEMHFSTSFSNGAFVAGDTMDQTDRLYGWLVGLGVEFPLFQDNIIRALRSSVIRAEYNYIRTERFSMDDVNPPFNGRYTARPQMHIFKVALVFKHDLGQRR